MLGFAALCELSLCQLPGGVTPGPIGRGTTGGVWLKGLKPKDKPSVDDRWFAMVREERWRRDYPDAFKPEAVNPVAERLIPKIVETETAENRDTSGLLLRLELEQRRQKWRTEVLDRLELYRRAHAEHEAKRREAEQRERRRIAAIATLALLSSL